MNVVAKLLSAVLIMAMSAVALYAQEEADVDTLQSASASRPVNAVQAAAALGPRELAQLMQLAHRNMQDMAAYFYQETLTPGNPNPVRAEGHVYMKRPDFMRWDYVKPEPQVVVVNEKAVYVYEKEVNQVMVMNREQFLSAEITRAFFGGDGELTRYFYIDTPGRGMANVPWTLKLVPVPDKTAQAEGMSRIKALWLTLNENTHLISSIRIEDQAGTRINISFQDMRLNGKLPDDLFRFDIPPGAEVFRQ
ncbi:MAG: outer membrane lipoprotein carrier protein LolA [Dissulfuribacterales bacterium]